MHLSRFVQRLIKYGPTKSMRPYLSSSATRGMAVNGNRLVERIFSAVAWRISSLNFVKHLSVSLHTDTAMRLAYSGPILCGMNETTW